MNDPLLGYQCKLNRAEEHLTALQKEFRAFLHPDCYKIVNGFEDKREVADGWRGILRRRVVFASDPPLLRWGAMIGDVIQNLRSGLDHLIYAISFSRDPAQFADDRTTEFPIFDNLDTFNRPRRRGWLPHHEIRGLPPGAQAIVKGLQPCHRGQDMHDDPLWVIHEMSNIDKHRMIHVVTWTADTVALDITGMVPGVRIHSHSVRAPGIIESGAPLVEIDMTIPESGGETVYMQKQFLFGIAFDESTPLGNKEVISSLYELGTYAAGVVDALSGFVKRP